MSATRVRIDANRANARLSTGPRTTEGKARSALNALRLGITAKSSVRPGESLDPYQKFTRKYVADPIKLMTELNKLSIYEQRLARKLAYVK